VTHSVIWPLASSSWDSREIAAMHEVINSGNFSMGARVSKFEREFAQWADSKFAIMVNSGSSANLLATAALTYTKTLKHFDSLEKPEVIVPAVSWSTTYFPFHQLGYKLVFVDVELDSFNLDTSKIERAISKNTVGICGVNLLGEVASWDLISKIAASHHLWTFEDNCESMGAEKFGKLSGTNGDVGTFSFFYSHHICTMEGGMVLCDDEELYLYMLSLRAHGWARGIDHKSSFFPNERSNNWQENFRFYLPGYNLRPLELAGAIGSEQLSKFPLLLAERRKNALILSEMLANINTSWRLQKASAGSSYFTFGFINVDKESGSLYRDRLVDILESNGVQTRPIVAGNFTLNPVMKYLSSDITQDLQNADIIHNNGLMIGNHHFDLSSNFKMLISCLLDSEI
jgi:CDP-6-deoxy-D-xylo-4-hexulose-3-dehydrase